MKPWFGSPGMTSGLILRILQCFFAASSIAFMASSTGFSTATSFCYLIAAMGLQVLWSFGLACLDIHALRVKKDLQGQILLSLVVVGDWVTSILALAAASSSAGVMVLFVRDSDFCKLEPILSCNMFQVSIALAFIAWFHLALSSHTTKMKMYESKIKKPEEFSWKWKPWPKDLEEITFEAQEESQAQEDDTSWAHLLEDDGWNDASLHILEYKHRQDILGARISRL